MKNNEKISFLTIVLNGMPFIPYQYRSIYPYAHEIIYVEGACPNASENATKDGHSNDGTFNEIKRLINEEDPQKKVKLITAEDCGMPSGFWPNDKTQMCQAGVKEVSGKWLWIIDNDEFYLPVTMDKICEKYLHGNNCDMISVPPINFWGGLNSTLNSWRTKQLGQFESEAPRIFRWDTGYLYKTHRPITITDKSGVDLRDKKWIQANELKLFNSYKLHYSYLFPKQVEEKCKYYSRMNWGYSKMVEWYKNNYLTLRNPFNVDPAYMYPSWLERYQGIHPPQILQMWHDVNTHQSALIRNSLDIDRILSNKAYSITSAVLRNTPSFLVKALEKTALYLLKIYNSIINNPKRTAQPTS